MSTHTYKYKLPPGLRNKDDEDLENPSIYPLLDIQLYHPDGGKPIKLEGLLDSGADGLFIQKEIAENLGLEVHEKGKTSGIGKSFESNETKVGLKIGRSKARRIDFGVVEATFPCKKVDRPILVGRDPLFKYFEVKFLEYKNPAKIKITQKEDLP